jgi:hypothetical protein
MCSDKGHNPPESSLLSFFPSISEEKKDIFISLLFSHKRIYERTHIHVCQAKEIFMDIQNILVSGFLSENFFTIPFL